MAKTVACLFIVLIVVAVTLVGQSILYVPADYPTIQAAIDAAQPGDTVYIVAGDYTENLVIDKPLSLIGEDQTTVSIHSANPEKHVITVELVTGEVSIGNLKVCQGTTGIAVRIGAGADADVKITSAIVYRNQVGIAASGQGSLLLRRSSVIDNEQAGLLLKNSLAALERNEIFGGKIGVLLLGAIDVKLTENLIGLCYYGGILTYTIGCGWNEGVISFAGRITGEENRISGIKSNACPDLSEKIWPNGFFDLTWQTIMDQVVDYAGYGVAASENEDYAGALAANNEALTLLAKARFPLMGAHLDNDTALIYYNLGRYKDALASYRAAQAVYMARGMGVNTAKTNLNIGTVYFELGRYQEAIGYFESAQRVFLEYAMDMDVAQVDENIGVICGSLGHFDEALAYFESAHEVYTAHDMDINVARNDWNFGNIYAALGQYKNALSAYRSARNVFGTYGMETTVAEIDENTGNVWEYLGRHEDALNAYQCALAVYKKRGLGNSVAKVEGNIGVIYTQLGRYEDALASYQEAVSILDKVPPATGMRYSYPATRWMIYNNIGLAHESLKEWDAAVTAYQDSIAVIESLRGYMTSEELKTAWQERTQDVYERLIKLLIDHGHGADAFPYAERCRARTFLDALYQGSITPNQLISPEAGISSGAVSPKAIDAAIKDGEGELQPNEAALEYFVTDEGIYLWAITKDGISAPLFIDYPREQLMNDVIIIRKALESSDLDEITRTQLLSKFLASFYAKLVKPGLDKLTGKKVDTLIFIPSGPLWYLPFSALMVTNQKTGTTSYLIERYTIAYLPSLASLSSLTKEGTQSPSTPFMALANPTLSAEQIKELGTTKYQYVQLEAAAEALRQRLAGKQEDVYVQGQAREPKAYQETPVHTVEFYGCHGAFNPKVPLQSKLFLGPGEGGTLSPDDERNPDGNYHAWEVLLTDHRGTELVILGACESLLPAFHNMQNTLGALSSQTASKVVLTEQQLKQIVVGDEVVGLARAFLSSGAESVLGTLWLANPTAIEKLLVSMADYHNQGETWAQALTEAQRDLIKDATFSNPWFWAPYQLIGRWR